ncbi:hypothetical protein CO112_00680 [Candidatus Dojkabacteria bacterium CG_4_9_14_3_um_filter_150_Dojkabacteria_WS6_41_13]|uniref:Fibronectin type-III domain-containing protein n=1 Tax=Candidatus Dojkabacteria bacterium CG_4_10_14_0_2_um_filter_Dojkabacteria_WS6_41_15 TaxID=2014249 RepID=A0A2M7W3H0_9BACT|nr:MAG: hypothetical protein COZ14_00990 [Candidatus Dojkabacteria bacterium CG_4_10_14_3_um_filter_Dojkabacteria_WS6_41_9]PJA15753.1 MAG: hypothetical protein COX64_00355 [Candidatus Dojkabacteria bacterium CG_4_10_14_0_2_um_filter_Dojkabacteria_WS6_41_15]PJB23525.1 MAG: hypothetical protein CO112_00680 [Candidatus Dojkabacteria bacterium CG_4_9_14_3_um_filter_150_Dojkabacteria_WS6_41_13]
MKQFLRKLVIIFGTLSIVLPILILTLWYKYIKEQEALYEGANISSKVCSPYLMTVSREQELMKISWKTTDSCSGFLLLGKTYSDFAGLPYKVLSAQGESPTTNHVVTLLKQDELQYTYVVIVSAGEWYGIKGNPFSYR